MKIIMILICALWVYVSLGVAETAFGQPPCNYYAAPSPTGSSSNNGLSQGSPFLIGNFWGVASPGSTLCLLNGTYTLANSAGTNSTVINIPPTVNGTIGSPVTVRCLNEAPGATTPCLIDGQGANQPVWIPNSNHIVLEGFDAFNSGFHIFSTGSGVSGGLGLTIRRVIAYNAGPCCPDDYGTFVLTYAGNVLMEDVATFGPSRNPIELYGDAGKVGHTRSSVRRDWGMWNSTSTPDGPREVIQNLYHGQHHYLENVITTWSCQPLGSCYPGSGATMGHLTPGANVGESADMRISGWIAYQKSSDSFNGPGLFVTQFFSGANPAPMLIENSVLYRQNPCLDCPFPNQLLQLQQVNCQNCLIKDTTIIGGDANPASDFIYQPEGGSWQRTNIARATTPSGVPNIWNGAGTSGARVCYQYQNGTLTKTPLWPWPMDTRIRAALLRNWNAGGPGARHPDTVFGGVGKSVTQQMEDLFGNIPSECRTGGPVVLPQLVLSLSFDQGSGSTAADKSGQGNNATLGTGVTWSNP